MNYIRAHVFIRDDDRTKFDYKCVLKEFLLSLLIFHIEKDIYIIVPLNDYELLFEDTRLKMTNKTEVIEIYFELDHLKSSLCISGLKNVIMFMQKIIYRQKSFKHKSFEIRACELKKCFRIEDEDIYEDISNHLEQERGCIDYKDKFNVNSCNFNKSHPFNPFFTMFLSSIIRFSNFMHFVIKTNKVYLIEKMIDLEDYEIMIYLLEYHKEIYNLFGYKDHIKASFYFVLSLFKNENFENYLNKDDYMKYVVLSGEYSKCIKNLQNESICPSSKEICYKYILNADSPHYSIIFNYVSGILNYNFYFLDTKLFFKQYKDLLSMNQAYLIYLNEGIIKIVNNCQFEMIFDEETNKIICPNRSIFYSETDFIHSFFNELQLFLEALFCIENISILYLMEGLTKRETGFIMKEIYLNTSFLNLIPLKWISPRMSLAVIKLCEVITKLNSPKLTKESKKILKVYSKWIDNSGLQYVLRVIND